jgi:uncharacterized protein YdaU (DUF1376 family)
MSKIRRIDFYPDEWLAGTKRLSAAARGVYITICALIYSEGRPLDYSDEDLAHECRMTVDELVPILSDLEQRGKIKRVRGRLTNERCEAELNRASSRIEKAKAAGRAGGKKTQSRKSLTDKDNSSSDRLSDDQASGKANAQAELEGSLKLTNNYQPPTNNQHESESINALSSESRHEASESRPEDIQRTSSGHGGDHPPLDLTPTGQLIEPGEDPVEEAVRLYNATAERCGLAKAQKITPARRIALRKRLSECGGLDGWRCALEKVEASSFCRGLKTEWRANLDFLCQQSSFVKLMEGAYDDHKPTGPRGVGRPNGLDSAFNGVEIHESDMPF